MKNLIFVLLCTFSLITVHARNLPAPQGAKEVLDIIEMAFQIWNKDNGAYVQPDEYITGADGKVLGRQYFTFLDHDKYFKVLLEYQGQNIVSATAGESKLMLGWKEGQLTTIKADGLYMFDYTVHYNEKGAVIAFAYNEIFNKKYQFRRTIEHLDGGVTKITAYENEVNKEKTWIKSIKTITPTDTGITLNCISYERGKSATPKNIKSNLYANYKKIDKDRFVTAAAWGDKVEVLYNADNKVAIKKVITRFGKFEERTYTYIDNKLFREIFINTDDKGFYEKTINLAFSLTGKPESTPDYEKTAGQYKFNKEGEMVWESRNSKWRAKVNGVWSDWQFFRM